MPYNRGQGKRAAPETDTKLVLELDKKKQVCVRQFNGVNLVDIREFYIDKDTQEKKPGKKGISLTEEVWTKLMESSDEINNVLSALNGKKRKTQPQNDASTADGHKETAGQETRKEKEPIVGKVIVEASDSES